MLSGGMITMMLVTMAVKRPKSLEAVKEWGSHLWILPLGMLLFSQLMVSVSEAAQSLIESKWIVCFLKQARRLNGPLDGPGNYLAIVFSTLMSCIRR